VVKKALLVLALLLPFLFASCEKKNALKIGHGGGYLSAALYAAQKELGSQVDIRQFNSLSDVAYSLLLGALDAGFVGVDKLAAFSELDGFEQLTVVGKITYPYGATLVLRKGLNLRLQELNGLTVAASSPHCVLLKEFTEDAKRLKANISDIKYEYMAFDAMIPALEAKAVDAAILRGTYSVIALQDGHSILYQNWEVKPGDECCPAIVDQAALVLLARRDKLNEIKPLLDALLLAQKLSPDQLRRAVADNTVIPFNILQGQPVPEFSLASDELVEIFVKAAGESHEDEDSHDE
jgi:ABC-type nitrate/sulfonate/bicarbonate transport system substrate-binding protein